MNQQPTKTEPTVTISSRGEKAQKTLRVAHVHDVFFSVTQGESLSRCEKPQILAASIQGHHCSSKTED